MFCPNCAAQNADAQHYCRTCGLKLDAIASKVAEQRPSPEYSALQRKRMRCERSGVASLSIAALIALCLVMGKAFYYKFLLLGPDVLVWSAIGAIVLFALASLFFFNYPKLIRPKKVNSIQAAGPAGATGPTTNKLPEPIAFAPASVTEHSTELLPRERRL
jgi:hypothetical protein